MAGKYKNKAYTLRIDGALMERLKEIADEEERTVNKQIEYILRKWVEKHDTE